jgi:hypothetical protein
MIMHLQKNKINSNGTIEISFTNADHSSFFMFRYILIDVFCSLSDFLGFVKLRCDYGKKGENVFLCLISFLSLDIFDVEKATPLPLWTTDVESTFAAKLNFIV